MAELLSSLNSVSVLSATIVYFALGALWYSPLLFAKPWIKLKNMPEDHEGGSPGMYIYTFMLQFIAVITLALFITALSVDSAANGAFIGFGAGAGFLFTLAGTTSIFSETPLKLHFIDNGYHVVGLTIAGLIIGWW